MQEDYLATVSQRSTEENMNTEKNTKQENRSWLSQFIFSCCKPQSPPITIPADPLKKSMSTVATHYSVGGPSSFLNASKNSALSPIMINTPVTMFPLDIVFLLGKGTNKIISKISKVNLERKLQIESPKEFIDNKIPQEFTSKKDSKKGDSESQSAEGLKSEGDVGEVKLSPFQIFSLYSERIQFEKGDWSESIPESIAKYAAEKLKDQLIIDTLSGNGENIIQFAKCCPHVIGVDTDTAKLAKAKQNSEIHQVQEKVDLIQANFFSLRKLKGDVVFFAPMVNSLEIPNAFSIDKHLTANLSRLVRHSLTMADSLCIMLPPFVDVEEIATLFCDIFNEDPNNYTNLNYSLQIDLLYSGESFVSTLVHLGGNNNIPFEEQLDVLVTTMNLNNNATGDLYSKGLIQQLVRYVGTHGCLKVILSLDDLIASDNCRNGALFETFLNKLKEKKIITREILRQFRKLDEYDLQESLLLEDGQLLDKCDPTLDKDMTSFKDLTLKQKKPSDRTLSKSPFKSPNIQPLPHNFKTENFRKANHLNCNVETHSKELNDSWDISAFALSSYSLTSAALLDSDSSDEEECKVEVPITISEKDSARSKRGLSEVSTSTPLKRASGKRNNSINRIKLLLFNLANQKVTNSPCMPLTCNSESSLVSKVI